MARRLRVWRLATAGVPKAGTFAEGAAQVVAASLLATIQGVDQPPPYDGRASCWIEFGGGRVRRVDIDFLSGPSKTGTLREPSAALVIEKAHLARADADGGSVSNAQPRRSWPARTDLRMQVCAMSVMGGTRHCANPVVTGEPLSVDC